MTVSSDDEQLQLVKSWWNKYRYYVLLTMVGIILLSLGWRYLHDYSKRYLGYASDNYTQMLYLQSQQKLDEYKGLAKKLIYDCPGSVYASLAALNLAKDAVESNDFDVAKDHLDFVVAKSLHKGLRQIARIRLARVLNELKKYDDALALLDKTDDDGYLANIFEARGDIFRGLGRLEEAEHFYDKAKELERNVDVYSPLLKTKLHQF